ncbi:uncharacterized protein M421DRAFT_152258 [Didymella exigua CBS 183.55]|uniref:Uncharacterized protein n=1 Tax=Didymella exigua CBS 183.55 TaxID=1150837 RepID=A0A6A5RTI1_9PLEO|nr:uncharacterized protein M421DRAFT_152258 [Didymella exigua CBS 183.55]KAF1928677.1 hypothetical protein M421DRAFT_152258 [Didymella exigua CBS 183.55]
MASLQHGRVLHLSTFTVPSSATPMAAVSSTYATASATDSIDLQRAAASTVATSSSSSVRSIKIGVSILAFVSVGSLASMIL